ncbi:MAG: TetR family transcriptional regulator [Candidatus Atribacteria bacterium]|nr:TetR family transcriptional regulator [Candidatus Atribacteria bacterium]
MVDPVNMQNIVVRSPEIAKVQRVQDERSSLQAQAFSAELQRQAQRAEETVDSHQKTYHYDKDQQKQKENAPFSRKKGEEGRKEEKRPEDGASGHLIDVKA